MARTLRPFRQVIAADEEWVSIIRDMLALKEKALNISFFSKTGYDFGLVYIMQGIISVKLFLGKKLATGLVLYNSTC